MLNKKKPYNRVFCLPGVGYEQDGRLFKPNGEPVGGNKAPEQLQPSPEQSQPKQKIKEEAPIYEQKKEAEKEPPKKAKKKGKSRKYQKGMF
jgi:hypothetical protein